MSPSPSTAVGVARHAQQFRPLARTHGSRRRSLQGAYTHSLLWAAGPRSGNGARERLPDPVREIGCDPRVCRPANTTPGAAVDRPTWSRCFGRAASASPGPGAPRHAAPARCRFRSCRRAREADRAAARRAGWPQHHPHRCPMPLYPFLLGLRAVYADRALRAAVIPSPETTRSNLTR